MLQACIAFCGLIAFGSAHATGTAAGTTVNNRATGFDDRDFSAARYTDQGPFIKLRIKADQDTFKDLGFDFASPAGR